MPKEMGADLAPFNHDLVAKRRIERPERDRDGKDSRRPKQIGRGPVPGFRQEQADNDERAERREVADAAVETRLGTLYAGARDAQPSLPTLDLPGERHQSGEADHDQHRPARRNANETVQ